MTHACAECTKTVGGALPKEVRAFAEECIIKAHPRSYLIPILHRLQSVVGYLRKEDMREVADMLDIPVVEVVGVATFYHFFTLTPKGKNTISVCLGTACHVKGAGAVLEKIQALLGLEVGETSEDKLFTLEAARCVGMCALAPVVTVNDKVYGNVTEKDVTDILREYGFEGDKK